MRPTARARRVVYGDVVEREEVIELPDGARLLFRPVRADDKALLVEGFERLGEDSRYRRFHGHVGRLGTAQLAYLTEVDHRDHEAIGALDCASGEGVGVARYVRLPDEPHLAEAAVIVADDWQRRGVASMLLERLVTHAREADIAAFTAVFQVENLRARELFERLGPHAVRSAANGTVELEIELGEPGDRGSPLSAALRAVAAGHIVVVRGALARLIELARAARQWRPHRP